MVCHFGAAPAFSLPDAFHALLASGIDSEASNHVRRSQRSIQQKGTQTCGGSQRHTSPTMIATTTSWSVTGECNMAHACALQCPGRHMSLSKRLTGGRKQCSNIQRQFARHKASHAAVLADFSIQIENHASCRCCIPSTCSYWGPDGEQMPACSARHGLAMNLTCQQSTFWLTQR